MLAVVVCKILGPQTLHDLDRLAKNCATLLDGLRKTLPDHLVLVPVVAGTETDIHASARHRIDRSDGLRKQRRKAPNCGRRHRSNPDGLGRRGDGRQETPRVEDLDVAWYGRMTGYVVLRPDGLESERLRFTRDLLIDGKRESVAVTHEQAELSAPVQFRPCPRARLENDKRSSVVCIDPTVFREDLTIEQNLRLQHGPVPVHSGLAQRKTDAVAMDLAQHAEVTHTTGE